MFISINNNWYLLSSTAKKISKAEKRRQKKSEQNKEREAKIKEEIENSKYSARNMEAEKLKTLLKSKNYKMFEIEPDGNW